MSSLCLNLALPWPSTVVIHSHQPLTLRHSYHHPPTPTNPQKQTRGGEGGSHATGSLASHHIDSVMTTAPVQRSKERDKSPMCALIWQRPAEAVAVPVMGRVGIHTQTQTHRHTDSSIHVVKLHYLLFFEGLAGSMRAPCQTDVASRTTAHSVGS